MAQTTETRIKTIRDGRPVIYRGGWLYVGDTAHAGYTAANPIPLTAAERKQVPAGYTCKAGSVIFTEAEATILRRAIADYDAALEAERRKPANVERRRIEAMYAKAEQLKDYPGDSIPLRIAADKALIAWREQYPDTARDEQRQALCDKAAHQRHLASGALTYDADGSISQEEQQRRHDEYMAKAAEYDRQASEL